MLPINISHIYNIPTGLSEYFITHMNAHIEEVNEINEQLVNLKQ